MRVEVETGCHARIPDDVCWPHVVEIEIKELRHETALSADYWLAATSLVAGMCRAVPTSYRSEADDLAGRSWLGRYQQVLNIRQICDFVMTALSDPPCKSLMAFTAWVWALQLTLLRSRGSISPHLG